MDDALFDVYDDLDEFDYKVKYEEAKSSNRDLQKQLDGALEKVSELENEKAEILEKIGNYEKSFHSLLQTARAEIQRKDTTIAEMRRDRDNIIFRRKGNNNRRAQEHMPKNDQAHPQHNIEEKQTGVKNNPFSGAQRKLPQDVTKENNSKYLNVSKIKKEANTTEDTNSNQGYEHDRRQQKAEHTDPRVNRRMNDKGCSESNIKKEANSTEDSNSNQGYERDSRQQKAEHSDPRVNRRKNDKGCNESNIIKEAIQIEDSDSNSNQSNEHNSRQQKAEHSDSRGNRRMNDKGCNESNIRKEAIQIEDSNSNQSNEHNSRQQKAEHSDPRGNRRMNDKGCNESNIRKAIQTVDLNSNQGYEHDSRQQKAEHSDPRVNRRKNDKVCNEWNIREVANSTEDSISNQRNEHYRRQQKAEPSDPRVNRRMNDKGCSESNIKKEANQIEDSNSNQGIEHNSRQQKTEHSDPRVNRRMNDKRGNESNIRKEANQTEESQGYEHDSRQQKAEHSDPRVNRRNNDKGNESNINTTEDSNSNQGYEHDSRQQKAEHSDPRVNRRMKDKGCSESNIKKEANQIEDSNSNQGYAHDSRQQKAEPSDPRVNRRMNDKRGNESNIRKEANQTEDSNSSQGYEHDSRQHKAEHSDPIVNRRKNDKGNESNINTTEDSSSNQGYENDSRQQKAEHSDLRVNRRNNDKGNESNINTTEDSNSNQGYEHDSRQQKAEHSDPRVNRRMKDKGCSESNIKKEANQIEDSNSNQGYAHDSRQQKAEPSDPRVNRRMNDKRGNESNIRKEANQTEDSNSSQGYEHDSRQHKAEHSDPIVNRRKNDKGNESNINTTEDSSSNQGYENDSRQQKAEHSDLRVNRRINDKDCSESNIKKEANQTEDSNTNQKNEHDSRQQKTEHSDPRVNRRKNDKGCSESNIKKEANSTEDSNSTLGNKHNSRQQKAEHSDSRTNQRMNDKGGTYLKESNIKKEANTPEDSNSSQRNEQQKPEHSYKDSIENSNRCDPSESRDRSKHRTRDEVLDSRNMKAIQDRAYGKTSQRRESRDERRFDDTRSKTDDRSKSSRNDRHSTRTDRDDKRYHPESSKTEKKQSSRDRDHSNNRKYSQERRDYDSDRQSDRKDRRGENGDRKGHDRDRRNDWRDNKSKYDGRANLGRDRRIDRGSGKSDSDSRKSAEKKENIENELTSNSRKREREDNNSGRSTKRKRLEDGKDRRKSRDSRPTAEADSTNLHSDIDSYSVNDLNELRRILESEISIEEQQEASANDDPEPKLSKRTTKPETTPSSRKQAIDTQPDSNTSDETNSNCDPNAAETIEEIQKDAMKPIYSTNLIPKIDSDAPVKMPEVPPDCNEGRKSDNYSKDCKSISSHTTHDIISTKSCKQPSIPSVVSPNCDILKEQKTHLLSQHSTDGEVDTQPTIKSVDFDKKRISVKGTEIGESQSSKRKQNNLEDNRQSGKSTGQNNKEDILRDGEKHVSNEPLRHHTLKDTDQFQNSSSSQHQLDKVSKESFREKNLSDRSKQEATKCANLNEEEQSLTQQEGGSFGKSISVESEKRTSTHTSEDNSKTLKPKSHENKPIEKAVDSNKTSVVERGQIPPIKPPQGGNPSTEEPKTSHGKREIPVPQKEQVQSNECNRNKNDESAETAKQNVIASSKVKSKQKHGTSDMELAKQSITINNLNVVNSGVTTNEIRPQTPADKVSAIADNAKVNSSNNEGSPKKTNTIQKTKFRIPKINKNAKMQTEIPENFNMMAYHMPQLDASFESSLHLATNKLFSSDLQNETKNQKRTLSSHDVFSPIDDYKNESSEMHNTSALISYETYLDDHISPVRINASGDESVMPTKPRSTKKARKKSPKSSNGVQIKKLTGHKIEGFEPEHTEEPCNLDSSRELKHELFKEVLGQRCSTPIKSVNDSSGRFLDASTAKAAVMESGDICKQDVDQKINEGNACPLEMDENKRIANDDGIAKAPSTDEVNAAPTEQMPPPHPNMHASAIGSSCNKNVVDKSGSSTNESNSSASSAPTIGTSSSSESVTSSNSSSGSTENKNLTIEGLIHTVHTDNTVSRSSPNQPETDTPQETSSSNQGKPISSSDDSHNFLTKKQKMMVQLMERKRKNSIDENVSDKKRITESEMTEPKLPFKRKADHSLNENEPPEKKYSSAKDNLRVGDVIDLNSDEHTIEDVSIIDCSILEYSDKTKLQNFTNDKEFVSSYVNSNDATEHVNNTDDTKHVHIRQEDLDMLAQDLHYSSSDLEKSLSEEIVNDSTNLIAGHEGDENVDLKFNSSGSVLKRSSEKFKILDIQTIPGGCASVVKENESTTYENITPTDIPSSTRRGRKASQSKVNARKNPTAKDECIEQTKSLNVLHRRSSLDKADEKQPSQKETKARKSPTTSDHKRRTSTITSQSSAIIILTDAESPPRPSSKRDQKKPAKKKTEKLPSPAATEHVNTNNVHIRQEDLDMLAQDLHYSSSDLEKSLNEGIVNDSTNSIAGHEGDENVNLKFNASGSVLKRSSDKIQILGIQVIPGCASGIKENESTTYENMTPTDIPSSTRRGRKASQSKVIVRKNPTSKDECIEQIKSSNVLRRGSSLDKADEEQQSQTETKSRKSPTTSDHKRRYTSTITSQSTGIIISSKPANAESSPRPSSNRDHNNPAKKTEKLPSPAAKSVPCLQPQNSSQTNSSNCLHSSPVNSSFSPNTSLSDSQYEKREISTKSSNYLIEKVDSNVINVFVTRKRVKKKKKSDQQQAL